MSKKTTAKAQIREALENKRTTAEEVINRHRETDELIDRIKKREEQTGRQLEIVATPDRDGARQIPVPLRAALETERIVPGRMAVWTTVTIGGMSIGELKEWIEEQGDKLSINELASIDLIRGVLQGCKEDKKLFWDMQTKLLGNKQVVNQINQITIKRDDTVKGLIDGIAEELFD